MVLLVLAGVGEGTVLGWAQSRTLRRELPGLRAGEWIGATAAGAAAAWVTGLVVVFAAIGAAPGDSPILIAAFGVAGGLGMGLTVALITGLFLVRLLDQAKPAPATGSAQRDGGPVITPATASTTSGSAC